MCRGGMGAWLKLDSTVPMVVCISSGMDVMSSIFSGELVLVPDHIVIK